MNFSCRGTDSISNYSIKAGSYEETVKHFKLHSATVRCAFPSVKFNFVHFSLGHPWECCLSQVKHEDRNGKSTEDLPRPSSHTMTQEY